MSQLLVEAILKDRTIFLKWHCCAIGSFCVKLGTIMVRQIGSLQNQLEIYSDHFNSFAD